MISAPKPNNEKQRLESLQALNILDTFSEIEYDQITAIASQICETPVALISLIDENRQWFKSKLGLSASETPREFAFCAHAILQDEVFIVENSSQDPRFFDNPLATSGPCVQFYAGAPILSPDGFPIGTVCVIDQKARKLNEGQIAALKALSNQVTIILKNRVQINQLKVIQEKLVFKTIAYENLSQGVVLQDRSGAIIEFNPAALIVLDLTADELTGKTSLDPNWGSIREDGSPFPGTEHPAMMTLKTGKPLSDVIMGIRSKSKGLRWIKINSNPLFLDSKETASHSVTSFSDISEVVKFEEDRRNFQIQLTEAERLSSLGQMAGGVAHEINNPLAIIKGKATLIRRKLETDKIDLGNNLKDFDLIEATVDRIAKIIKGLKNYSRNAENDPFESINAQVLIDDTLELCKSKFTNRLVELKISCPPDLFIQCRPAQISQILLNLLGNSSDAIENFEEKWIQVKVKQINDRIHFIVSDSGSGISPEIVEKLMRPFFTTKPLGKGTGLGLSISKGIAEAHGGKLSYLESEKNTTFVLDIPAQQNGQKYKVV
jgi:signal transduction histidine kinase